MALAVSGGSDSMALLRLAQECLGAHCGKEPHPSRAEDGARHLPQLRCAKPEKDEAQNPALIPLREAGRVPSASEAGGGGAAVKLSALTVDHGLRLESASEAKQVAEWCGALGVEHHILRWTGEKPGTGIQAKARAARYDLMAAWCREQGVGVLLTAHTLDDQAETVLMRLARTSSLDSLSGIPRHGQWKGLRLYRPLLGERRERLRSYLQEIGQGWIDDPSNDDPRFERVRIRKVLPGLAEIGVTPERLAALAEEASEVTQALWGAADDWTRTHVTAFPEGYCQFGVSPYDDQTEGLKTRILALLIQRFGGGKWPEPAELSLLSAWLSLQALGRRTLGGAIIVRRKRSILLGREPGRIDAVPVTVPASGTLVWDRRFEITAAAGSKVAASGRAIPQARREDLPAFVQASLPVLDGVRGFAEDWARFRYLNSP